jgi:hypothetical protein
MNNRLVIVWENDTPDNSPLTFTNLVDVEDRFGIVSPEAKLATNFFSTDPSGTLTFIREGLGQRSHLIGANIWPLANNLLNLQSINGPLSVVFNGNTYGTSVNLASATSFAEAATLITASLNSHLLVEATATGCTVTPETTQFTGSFSRAQLTVYSVQSSTQPGAGVDVGGIIAGSGVIVNPTKNQIIYQHSGTPGQAGAYSSFGSDGNEPNPEPMTETYGVLNVGAVASGTLSPGQELAGANIPNGTALIAGSRSKFLGSRPVVDQ